MSMNSFINFAWNILMVCYFSASNAMDYSNSENELDILLSSHATITQPFDDSHGRGNALVVDDNNVNLKVMKEILLNRVESIKFNAIVTVSTGLEALAAIQKDEYKIIFMDIDLGVNEMNGIEAAHLIKEELEQKNRPLPPIIAVTARENFRYEHHGMRGYIPKPFNLAKIEEQIRLCFNAE